MGRKHSSDLNRIDSDLYDGYEEELGDDLDNLGSLSKDFYSTDWEDPAGPESRFSARRKIERRNDLKALHSQFDDWDELDLNSEW